MLIILVFVCISNSFKLSFVQVKGDCVVKSLQEFIT